MMKTYFFLSLSFLFLFSCNSSQKKVQTSPNMGIWRAELQREKVVLPFNFTLVDSEKVQIHNASERLPMNYFFKNDSIHIKSPIFDSEIIAKIEENGTKMKGFWHNRARKDKNRIPFSAEAGVSYRFKGESETTQVHFQAGGRWSVTFDVYSNAPYDAIGEFEQKGNILTGTFLTETGDYRFLQGYVKEDELFLTCFDGSHAFYFSAMLHAAKAGAAQFLLDRGVFYSGLHHYEQWEAMRDSSSMHNLRPADTLTHLKKGYEAFTFSFPNVEKKQVSLQDAKYKNKAVIVQLMGSWCPNCMDETAYLAELHKKYNDKGLEIIGLAYERSNDFDKAAAAVKRIQTHFNAQYDFLIAGTSNKEDAANTLPMLNHIMAYPTTIFVDKKGKVRKIHTGFSGPATGKHYQTFTQETEAFLEKLLAEK
ncbi:MAG: TlpA family protein disulfide reductase [Bacteroidia bacterium]